MTVRTVKLASGTYKISGKPNAAFDGKSGLTIDPKTGQIVKAKERPADKSPRTAFLKTFDPNGDQNEVLRTLIYGGVPGKPRQKLAITRKTFFEIISRIVAHDDLVQEIVDEWARQMKNYLSGADDNLPPRFPNPRLFQHLCAPDNPSHAAVILSSLRSEIIDQIVKIKGQSNESAQFLPLNLEYLLADGDQNV